MQAFVTEIWQETKNSAQDFPLIFSAGDPKYPIPFFGNPLKAEIFTVGVNPSAGEFSNREWQNNLSPKTLTDRLLNYFNCNPHPWFCRWSNALNSLKGKPSYANGEVAHLDISPRATGGFGGFNPEQAKQFEIMLRRDIRWFFRLLAQSENLKLILMAGTASQKLYLDNLVGRCAGQNAFALGGRRYAKGKQCRFWELKYKQKTVPIFFSGSSPSDRRNPNRLAENLNANRDDLNTLI